MTDNQKDTSIEYILKQGFTKPPSLRERITKMHRVLGWRFIFWDLSYSIIFVFVTLLATMFLFRHVPVYYFQYSVAVGFSPILFVLITLLVEINERACSLYQLKQTCRYTSRQITALRCIYYSLAGVAFAIAVAALSSENTANFFRILPLCLGVLFLCATLELSVLRLSHSKWTIAGFSVVWMLINFSLPVIFGGRWEAFLSNLPLIFTVIFMIMCAIVFMYQTNKMLTEGKTCEIFA